jgi:hypothetical protein
VEDERLIPKKNPTPRPPPIPASPAVREAAREAANFGWKEFRRMRDEHVNDLRNAVIVCVSCRKDASHLEDGNRLRACVKCKSVGRTTRYCSRCVSPRLCSRKLILQPSPTSECQVKDWKEGKPVPHKEVCGTAVPELPKPVVDPDKRIPIPDPSFKRSPALLRQIAFLRRPPFSDYVVSRVRSCLVV